MKKIILFLCATMLVASCVYPFVMDMDTTEGRIVVSGDIIVGEEFSIDLSLLEPLNGEDGVMYYESPFESAWVEGSDGSKFYGVPESSTRHFKFDMRNASFDHEYRLHFTTDGKKEYASDWGRATARVEVDSLYYQVDMEKQQFLAKADFHAEGSSQYFSVNYREVWEYTSIYRSMYEYVPRDMTTSPGRYRYGLLRDSFENNYRCWSTANSRGFQVLSSEGLSESTFKDIQLASLSRSDRKLSVCYFMEVAVMPVTQEAYEYMRHVDEMSNSLGDLFSPNPSEMRGNVRNVDDPDELVIGFVSVTHKSVKSMYVLDSVLKFYKYMSAYPQTENISESSWPSYYERGWLPYDYDPQKKTAWWAPNYCVDCRYGGGVRQKPAGWPTKGN